MSRRLITALTASALALTLALCLRPALAQGWLPEGPGRETTEIACSGCHEVGFLVGVPRSRAQWDNTMLRMINRGMMISSEDYGTVVVYLATYIGLTPPPAPVPSVLDAASAPAPDPALDTIPSEP